MFDWPTLFVLLYIVIELIFGIDIYLGIVNLKLHPFRLILILAVMPFVVFFSFITMFVIFIAACIAGVTVGDFLRDTFNEPR